VTPTRIRHRIDLASATQRFAVVASKVTPTNRQLIAGARRLGREAWLLGPAESGRLLVAGDVALGRLDVEPTLGGVEPGLEMLDDLEAGGVKVRNGRGALLGTHDKLLTATLLVRAGVPHPRTVHVLGGERPHFERPVVVKPRFGSWGQDVAVCHTCLGLLRCLARLRERDWFNRGGAIVQELVEPQGYDLRILVAGGEVVGAVSRIAAPGEWRTNVALGATRCPVVPPPQARVLALDAARAIGVDLAGVDLLPDGNGGYVVLEVNGAVDFTQDYSLEGEDVFDRAISALLSPSRYARAVDEEEEAPLAFCAGTRS
jgi:[lysine-biosynthesis-protein LysW]--L-2-aminoadipate ligase